MRFLFRFCCLDFERDFKVFSQFFSVVGFCRFGNDQFMIAFFQIFEGNGKGPISVKSHGGFCIGDGNSRHIDIFVFRHSAVKLHSDFSGRINFSILQIFIADCYASDRKRAFPVSVSVAATGPIAFFRQHRRKCQCGHKDQDQ